MKKQSGFTLIEIAIVLVIIGLLLGGVLKGQEMIENGKVKNLVNDFNGVVAAYNSYRDRYRQIPGDDSQATARGWTTVAALANGNGNGQLTPATPFAANGENLQFWLHLRGAQLITGDTATGATVSSLPKNAFGGYLGVRQTGGLAVLGGLGPVMLCAANIPAKAAVALDTQLDDGNPSTGSVRASVFATANNQAPAQAANTPTYVEPSYYTICRQL